MMISDKIQNKIKTLSWEKWSFLSLFISCLLIVGCQKGEDLRSHEQGKMLTFSLRNINDPKDAETKVETVRIVIADPTSGQIFLNQLLTWDGGTKKTPIQGKYSDAMEFSRKGAHDIYLFANEANLSEKNQGIIKNATSVLQFAEIEPIAFTSTSNVASFLSMGVKKGVVIVGGSKENPQKIDASLVRHLSKIEVSIKRKDGSDTSKDPNVKITKLQLIDLPTNYSYFFKNNFYPTTLTNSNEVSVNISDEKYSTSEELFNKTAYIPEHLTKLLSGGAERPTLLRVFYKAAPDYNEETSSDFRFDSGEKRPIVENILSHLGERYANLNLLSRYSIYRGMYFKVTLNITEKKLTPEMEILIQPWNEQQIEYKQENYLFNATKNEVMLNFPSKSANEVMVLSNFDDNRSLRVETVYEAGVDNSWLSILSPADLAFYVGAQNKSVRFVASTENLTGVPRSVTVRFSAGDYKYPIEVKVTQRPRQITVAQRYINFIGTGGTESIKVNNFGYDWQAEIVSNFSTLGQDQNWLKVTKEDDDLKVQVSSTEDKDLIRYAMVKLYDGSGHSAYIWVEQGNYKPVTIAAASGQNITILDRNLGAVKAASQRNAWYEGAKITNRERVFLNGFYYQYGRVPDGYHTLGIDLLNGTLLASIPDEASTFKKIDLGQRPMGYPLKWSDLGEAAITGKSVQDEQYGKFIKGEDQSAYSIDRAWYMNTNGQNIPKWTDENGDKREGVDPCPKGYRVPKVEELKSILYHEGNNDPYARLSVSAGIWLPTTNYGTHNYIPVVARRNAAGSISQREWFYDDGLDPSIGVDYQLLGYYGASDYSNPGGFDAFQLKWDGQPWSWSSTQQSAMSSWRQELSVASGVVIRCIKEK